MTLSVPQQVMTNAITKGARSAGTWQFSYYPPACWETQAIFCQRHHVLTDFPGKQLLGAPHAIQGFQHPPNFPWKATANTEIIQSSKIFFFFFFFFLAFEDTPPSISPQLPLKHNRCLPTRLPSTSCLVTGSPLLSTTERLANSMSGLNLETPLIHPPHWIDRSWLHRGSRSLDGSMLDFHPRRRLSRAEIKSCQLL